jgi:hypothetical protein
MPSLLGLTFNRIYNTTGIPVLISEYQLQLKCSMTDTVKCGYFEILIMKICLDILNFSFNLRPTEEKFIQIYLFISKTLIIHNSKEKICPVPKKFKNN